GRQAGDVVAHQKLPCHGRCPAHGRHRESVLEGQSELIARETRRFPQRSEADAGRHRQADLRGHRRGLQSKVSARLAAANQGVKWMSNFVYSEYHFVYTKPFLLIVSSKSAARIIVR